MEKEIKEVRQVGGSEVKAQSELSGQKERWSISNVCIREMEAMRAMYHYTRPSKSNTSGNQDEIGFEEGITAILIELSRDGEIG